MIVQTFDLNLIPDQDPVVVHVDQYDTETGRLLISLYEGDLPYTPSGTAIIQGTKPDGHGFNYSCTLSSNTVTVNLTNQMTAVAGDVRSQIVITESSGRTGTFAFILRVQKSALPDDADMSESEYQVIEELIEEAQEAAVASEESAEDSEAWAVGTRDGVPVSSGDPTYNNNSKYWAEHGGGSVPTMTASILGIGSPDGMTTDVTSGIFRAKGVAIYCTVNSEGTEHGADWLKYNGNVITPDTISLYLVYISSSPTLWVWTGSIYTQVSGGGGGGSTSLVSITQSDFNALSQEQKDDASIWWWISDATGAISTAITSYNVLANKPQINGVTLTGNIQSSILGIVGADIYIKGVVVENTASYGTGTGGNATNSIDYTVTKNGKTYTYVGLLDPVFEMDNTVGSSTLPVDTFSDQFKMIIRAVIVGSSVMIYRRSENTTGVTLTNVKVTVPAVYVDLSTIIKE